MQKPKAMYLDYCQKYASLHLKKSQIIIEDYKFKMEDVMNETFSYDVIQWIKYLGTRGQDPLSLSDEEFAALFETETIKLFTDFIYHGSDAYIVVKSWQKVIFKMSEDQQPKKANKGRSQSRDKTQKNKDRDQKIQIDKNIINTALYSQPH